MPPPQPSKGVLNRTNPEVAAEPSDVPANTQTPIGAVDGGVAPPQGVTNDQEMGGLLPPSHWTQLAEVGKNQQLDERGRGIPSCVAGSCQPLPSTLAD